MFSKFAKISLAATSIAPVFLTLWFVEFSKKWVWYAGLFYLILALVLTIICLVLLEAAKKRLEKLKIQIVSVKSADNEMIGFVIAYLLPLINKSALDVNIWVLIFIISLLFWVVLTSNSYHFNPLIGLFNHHFYEVTLSGGVSYVLITKKNISDCKSIKHIVHVSEYMIMEI